MKYSSELTRDSKLSAVTRLHERRVMFLTDIFQVCMHFRVSPALDSCLLKLANTLAFHKVFAGLDLRVTGFCFFSARSEQKEYVNSFLLLESFHFLSSLISCVWQRAMTQTNDFRQETSTETDRERNRQTERKTSNRRQQEVRRIANVVRIIL